METEYKFGEESERKKIFIEELKKFPNFEKACAKIGIARSTGYRWRDKDAEFAKAIDGAKNQGVDFINDMAEAQLISAIRDKNLKAIEMWLKAHHRAYSSRLELSGKVEVETNDPLSPEQQRLIKTALELAGLVPEETDRQEITK
jgi:hypothetical protein